MRIESLLESKVGGNNIKNHTEHSFHEPKRCCSQDISKHQIVHLKV